MTIRLLTTEELDIITGGASSAASSGALYSQSQAVDAATSQSLADNVLGIVATQTAPVRGAQTQAADA